MFHQAHVTLESESKIPASAAKRNVVAEKVRGMGYCTRSLRTRPFGTIPEIGGMEKGGYCINCFIRLRKQSLQRIGKCP